MAFEVDEACKTPLYRQIADWLDGRILRGELSAGYRLPTERMLCAELNVARGTVKNAYIELEKRGKIEKIQGKGTFVVGGSPEKQRETAVNAIRKTLVNLRTYNMGEQEIVEVIKNEAWNRLSGRERVRVVWVDSCPELLGSAVNQISQSCNVTTIPCLTQDLISRPDSIAKPFDLFATSLLNYGELVAAVGSLPVYIERVVLTVQNRTVSELAKLQPGQSIAVLYDSLCFYGRVREDLEQLGLAGGARGFCTKEPLDAFYAGLPEFRAVLAPPDCLCAQDDTLLDVVVRCQQRGTQILPFEYALDAGSLLHLKECAQICWETRVLGRRNAPQLG